MLFVGVDLAERHSAAVAISDSGKTVWEHTLDAGAKEKPPRPFVHMTNLIPWWSQVVEFCTLHDDPEVIWAVENVHHRAIDYAPALRLQGGLLALMAMTGVETHLITAHDWQNFFGYSKKEHLNSKKWAATKAESFGYTVGNTIARKLYAKEKTDLVDAYLIAQWVRHQVLCLTPA